METPIEWQRWEERFSVPEYVFGTEPNAFLKSQAGVLPKTGKALAIADGEGRNGVWLAEQGLDVAVDGFLADGAGEGAGAGARAWRHPAHPAGGHHDVGLAGRGIRRGRRDFLPVCVAAGARRIFAGMRKALKPGGLLLLEGYGPKQLEYKTGGPSELENLYTEELLREEFAGIFRACHQVL